MYNDGAFEWDENKARLNLKEHKVGFPLATRVFEDPNRIIDFDRVDEETVKPVAGAWLGRCARSSSSRSRVQKEKR